MSEVADLHLLSVPELVARYEEVYGRSPRVKHKGWLWKRVAWKLQEKRLGGLSKVAKRKLEELISDIDLPLDPKPKRRRKPDLLKAGTSLVREWHGQQIRVLVLDQGFEWNGETYTSLSAVAKAITGSHWNGRLFFGLTTRRKAR